MCAAPKSFRMATAPSAPIGVTTRLAAVFPGWVFRLDVPGTDVPDGYTVRNVDAVAPRVVTLSTTAETPPTGTPACPATGTVNDAPAPIFAPDRVSATRVGVTAVILPPLGNQPTTSTMRYRLPALLKSETFPSAPTGTIARLLATVPGIGFRFDVLGTDVPVG